MAGSQDVRDGIARVVGGTAPDLANRPRWFSGNQTGDSTGVTSMIGCWSAAQGDILQTGGESVVGGAIGLVLLGPGNVHWPAGTDTPPPSQRYTFDNFRLLILIGRADPETEDAILAPFRDSVTLAFDTHMTLFSTANVIQSPITAWRSVTYRSGGKQLIGWEMTVRVMRVMNVTYAL